MTTSIPRERLVLLLQGLGCTTQEVHEGPPVVDAAKSFRPDAILLDIGLPGLDGYQMPGSSVRRRSFPMCVSLPSPVTANNKIANARETPGSTTTW